MWTRQLVLLALVAALFGGPARSQNVVISEFMASNARTLADENGLYPDWLELYNPGASAVNLNGWYLTQNPANLAKWRIPAVTLPPKGFLVIFCDKTDKAVAGAPLHTNFNLSASGDYLALVKPDGGTVACEYAPKYPPQQTDVSYGTAFVGNTTSLVAPGAPAAALVPSNGSLGISWAARDFNDAAWTHGTTGVGYERGSGYESMIGLDLGARMYNITPSAYIRIPFTVPAGLSIDELLLRVKVDDGFVAYLNGTPAASFHAPATPAYNSPATGNYEDSLAVQYLDFDVSGLRSALSAGPNVLAIQGLNVSTTSSDFLVLPELIASTGDGVDRSFLRYFTTPTPGAPNGTGSADQGPLISQVAHAPAQPAPGEPFQVTARIAPQASPLASATLYYRLNFGPVGSAPLYDDGAHGDGAAGDGIFGAPLPSSAYGAGQLVRYYVTASDAAGHAVRYPPFANPTASPEYLGTVVRDASIVTALPVLYWFVASPGAAGTETGTQSTLFYNGVLYDNVFTKLRGQTSAYWPKKHYNITMNSGEFFQFDPAKEPLDEINLQSTYSDKSYVRSILAWETYEQAGVPGCLTFPVRVQQNGIFFSVATILEQPGGEFLTRVGLDADGALYKMYSDASNIDGVEKKTRKREDNSDLLAFVAGLPNTGAALTTFLFDNLDVPEAINYTAATTIMHDNDHVGKNYFLYRDTDGSRYWSILPWDKDLTFGRNFVPWDGGVLADIIWAGVDPYSHPLFGDAQHPKVDGPWNRVIDAMYREPTIRGMYLRRLRTLMDDLLQPPYTPDYTLKYEKRIDNLVSLLTPDVLLDRARWGNPYGEYQGFPAAISILKNSYLAARRTHLYNTHGAPNGMIPGPQTGSPAIAFGPLESQPASGNLDQQYLTLVNPNSTDVDISGWSISGSVSFTFRPGTVIPAGGTLYVSPNVVAFRARSSSPRGGQGLFVVGNWKQHLPAASSVLRLISASGNVIAVRGYEIADVQAALRIAAGQQELDGNLLERYNLVPDFVVDLADAVGIARAAAGLDG